MIKKLIILVCLISFATADLAFAQQKADSLKELIGKTTNNTELFRLKAEYAYELAFARDPQTESIVNEILAANEATPATKAKAHHALGIHYLNSFDAEQSVRNFEKSIEIRLKINEEEPDNVENKEGLASSYNNLGNIYLNFSDFTKTLDYYERSLRINEELGDKKWIGYSLYTISTVHLNKGDYTTALEKLNRALVIFEEINEKRGIGFVYNDLGNIFEKQGGYDKALDYYLRSLRISEEINDIVGMATTLNNVGNIHLKQENYESSLDYYFKSLKIRENVSDLVGMTGNYNNIGTVYLKMADKDTAHLAEALNYFQKTLEMSTQLSHKQYEASARFNLGEVFKRMSRTVEALKNYSEGVRLMEQIGDLKGMAAGYNNMGSIYNKMKEYTTAITILKQALNMGNQMNLMDIKRESSYYLSQAYSATGDYKNAFDMLALSQQMRDSLNNEEMTKRITQLAMQYQFDQKQKQLEFEQHEKDIKSQAELQRQKLIRNAVSVGLLLMIAVAFLIFKNYQQKKRDNALLFAQKQEIEKQRDEIQLRNDKINEQNHALEQQKEEITAQRDEIEMQRDFVIEQRDKIAEQRKSIVDSIQYASRIQQALLTPLEIIKGTIYHFFIYYNPRDIVSGDFYWAKQVGTRTIIAAADCTGHGVPGALMSMLGISFLNEIITVNPKLEAHELLNDLRRKVIESLHQLSRTSGNETKDGMDMSLVILDRKNNTLQFAGANNGMYLVRNNELIKFDADRMPIGIYHQNEVLFQSTTQEFYSDDVLYLYSDGYADQFGGPKDRKFMAKRMQQLLLDNHQKPMHEQKEILHNAFIEWKGSRDQVDDILVIGLKCELVPIN